MHRRSPAISGTNKASIQIAPGIIKLLWLAVLFREETQADSHKVLSRFSDPSIAVDRALGGPRRTEERKITMEVISCQYRRRSAPTGGGQIWCPRIHKGGRPTGEVDRRCRARPSCVVGGHSEQNGASHLGCGTEVSEPVK